MGPAAVEIQDISKRFRLYHEKYSSLKEKVIHAGHIPYDDLWALRNVSFDVKEGETLGILGRNGSGKSTLLKCVCGVLQPTSGQVVLRGKLAGLLELGAGFQPDLSGRENIYLNGSLLGMTKSDVDKVFDEVVAFAELEHFIDNQVKFYSSGMYIRLGFAIAVNVDPDILVIDEVLAVGDERFQRKCIERVQEFQEEGRTIIFVTHSSDQIRAVCDRAVVLSDGQLLTLGTPGETVRFFREELMQAGDVLHEEAVAPPVDANSPPGSEMPAPAPSLINPMAQSHPVRLTEVTTIHPGSGERPYMVTGDPLTIRVGFEATSPTKSVGFVVELRDDAGTMLLRADSSDLDRHFDVSTGKGAVEFRYAAFPFLDGVYQIFAGIESRSGGVLYDWREPAAQLEVMNPGKEIGTVSLPFALEMQS